MPFVCCLSSPHRLSSVSVVFDFIMSLNDVTPASPIPLPVDLKKMEKSGLLMDAFFHITILCSPQRLRAVIVVFDFNASHSEAAPLSPISNPVYLRKMEKSGLLNGCHW